MMKQQTLDGYDAFVAKFVPKKTTDDCYTPKNVYETVRSWAVKRYKLEGAEIVRPFWPGADYKNADYPDGCAVIDNPPFSILSSIVAWYNANGVRFFLFAPTLTSISCCRDGKTAFVATNISIVFENGAKVNTSFLTNMEPPDVLATTASDLFDELEAVNNENEKKGKKKVTPLVLPNEVITGAGMGYLAVHHTPYTVRRADAVFVRKLDNYAKGIFGGGFLLTPRAAAERAAAERAAAERAACMRLSLSARERELLKLATKIYEEA